jgi:hypothetical protein
LPTSWSNGVAASASCRGRATPGHSRCKPGRTTARDGDGWRSAHCRLRGNLIPLTRVAARSTRLVGGRQLTGMAPSTPAFRQRSPWVGRRKPTLSGPSRPRKLVRRSMRRPAPFCGRVRAAGSCAAPSIESVIWFLAGDSQPLRATSRSKVAQCKQYLVNLRPSN